MPRYRIMTNNQKAFEATGLLSEIIRPFEDTTTMVTAIRIDDKELENCASCRSFKDGKCKALDLKVPENEHCQLWIGKR